MCGAEARRQEDGVLGVCISRPQPIPVLTMHTAPTLGCKPSHISVRRKGLAGKRENGAGPEGGRVVTESRRFDRRAFLKAFALGSGALAVSASGLLTLASLTTEAGRREGGGPPPRNFSLRAREGVISTVDGTSLYARGFSDATGAMRVPGPALWAREGEWVTMTLLNDASQEHGLVIDGVAAALPAPPGGATSVAFSAPHAGTYIYYDPAESPLDRALGMYGALIITPSAAPDRVWTEGPSFARQHLQVLSELDEGWNTASGLGAPVDTGAYRPNYFFLNGRGFPDSDVDPDAHIRGSVGETILIRWANAGLVPHSLHTHGYHFRIAQQDGRPEPAFREKDNVPIYPGRTMDVLVTFDQPGLFPIHDHILMANTGNGVYPRGIMGMFEVV